MQIWIEYLRVLAVIAVVTIHTTSSTYKNFGNIPINDWWFANILNTFSRFSVPIFVMISGCVLLGRSIGIKDFYIKRGIRLLPALLFWSLFYIAFDYVFNNRELNSILYKLKFGLIISGKSYFHLWYLSMYICLMIFAPFINSYIIGKKPTLEDFIYIFIAFALFMALNQISSIGREVFNKNMSWFKLFPWYIGYFVMGYFIDAYNEKICISNRVSILILGILLVISCTLNFYSASTLGIVKDYFILNNTGILNFIITILIFNVFSKNRIRFAENKLISSIASASFGIYLIHPVFLFFIKTPINNYLSEPIIGLPLIATLTFLLSFLTISVLTRIKVFKTIC